MKIAIPDVISNSYFPVIAACELGFFEREGVDMEFEAIFPVDHTLEVLRDGGIDFVGGSAHSVPFAFPGWKGGRLIAAQAQNMYWFLVLRADLGAKRGEIEKVKGLNLGAAPLVNLGLKRLLVESGLDEERDGITIGPVPGAFLGENKNFGVAAAKALEHGLIDGFWANGMGAEVAVTSGAGTLVIDARRGDGPPGAVNYTMSSIITSDAVIERDPEAVAGVVRAIVRTQQALKEDVSLATKVGEKWFPELEASLIAQVVERDLPYYDATITPEFVEGMLAFQRAMGLIREDAEITYDDVVATQYAHLWKG
jgi:ABC-type nitrate/sulfonate/bicarbonate transport system substrate-binding protein